MAWCKDAVECIEALRGGEGKKHCRARSESQKGRGRDETRRTMMETIQQSKCLLLSWCKRGSQRLRTFFWTDGENLAQKQNGDGESSESSVIVNVGGNDVDDPKEHTRELPAVIEEKKAVVAKLSSNAELREEAVQRISENRERNSKSNVLSSNSQKSVGDGKGVEDVVMVNNLVVDNELGGGEVTVLPSWEKMKSGIMEGRFTPSKWLQTDRVLLNTVRWSGAYLCGMGEYWSVDTSGDRSGKECGGILESLFSRETEFVLHILKRVEWDLNLGKDGCDYFSIHSLGHCGEVDLTGEESTAYGGGATGYDVGDTSTVDAYSFEFSSLVSSYPTMDMKIKRIANRERIGVGLVHSVLLAKHLGVAKLKTVRRYYDRHRLREGIILRKAFKLLLKQTNTHIPDNAMIWRMFGSIDYQIPIFPYRMQMVALWDQATNWRVLQASSHQDIDNSKWNASSFKFENKNKQRVLCYAPHPVNIFDYCAEWTVEQIEKKLLRRQGSLGVVIETVRTFLAEWITANTLEPNWEPDIPLDCVEFNTGKIEDDDDQLTWICQREVQKEVARLVPHNDLIWKCQRELQKMIAKMSRNGENFAGNPALIMLLILGFPLLCMDRVRSSDVGSKDNQCQVPEASGSLWYVHVYRAWSHLAPQDISLIIRFNILRGTVSLRLHNDSCNAQFVWQDWLDAAMGCLKGFEDGKNSELGYGRKIIRPNLREQMVELCQLYVNGYGIGAVMDQMSTARVWLGWPAFDVRICKFEMDQWLDACNVNIREGWIPYGVIESFERVMETMMSAEKEKVEASAHDVDV